MLLKVLQHLNMPTPLNKKFSDSFSNKARWCVNSMSKGLYFIYTDIQTISN